MNRVEINKGFLGKSPRVFCNSCGKVVDYQVAEIKLGTILITSCDNCLQELNRKIVEYLAEKNL